MRDQTFRKYCTFVMVVIQIILFYMIINVLAAPSAQTMLNSFICVIIGVAATVFLQREFKKYPVNVVTSNPDVQKPKEEYSGTEMR